MSLFDAVGLFLILKSTIFKNLYDTLEMILNGVDEICHIRLLQKHCC